MVKLVINLNDVNGHTSVLAPFQQVVDWVLHIQTWVTPEIVVLLVPYITHQPFRTVVVVLRPRSFFSGAPIF